jgi:hypothetical protein
MLLSTNTTNQKDFRAVQEVKAKNGVGPDENPFPRRPYLAYPQ